MSFSYNLYFQVTDSTAPLCQILSSTKCSSFADSVDTCQTDTWEFEGKAQDPESGNCFHIQY